MSLLNPGDRNLFVDVYKSQLTAQASKIYIEKLIIHPLKITLTFVQTPFPRKTGRHSFQATALNMLTSLAGVDRMQLKLKSFEVEDVLESWSSLVGLIKHKTYQDLQSQLAQIAGTTVSLLLPFFSHCLCLYLLLPTLLYIFDTSLSNIR
jgi:Vacuolar-sorting-associated 13 protein C-terminal